MDKKKISVLFLLETKSIYTEKRGKDIFTFFNIINTKSLTLMMKRRLEWRGICIYNVVVVSVDIMNKEMVQVIAIFVK